MCAWCFSAALIVEVFDFVRSFDDSPAARDLKCVDLFCGTGQVCQTFQNAGHAAERFDVKMGADFNFLRKECFYKALNLVLRLAAFGVLVAGPPCSYFVWMSFAFHRRTKS